MRINELTYSRRYTPEKAAKAFAKYGPAGDPDDIAGSRAPRTEIQYGSAWSIYTTWCDGERLVPMPADGKQMLAYFRHLRERKLTPATCEAYIGAVCAIHRINNHAVDRSAIVEPMKAYLRKNRTQRRASPLLGKVLRDLVGRLDPGKLRDVRDAAILLLAFSAALRSSEVVGLDLNRIGPRRLGATGALILDDDETVVELETSKSSQLTTTEIVVPAAEMPSLKTWLDRWLALAGVNEGEPVFRAILGSKVLPRRLAAETVLDIVRRRMCQFAFATGKKKVDAAAYARSFSSHSARRGYCTTAARKHIPLDEIRARSRHRSDDMLGRYIASAELRRSSGLKGVGF